MPDKGYDLQTGGSARRSFIKNNDDTYYIHGVPGHTHNASAMISVTAEYSRKRGIVRTIGTAWANEPVVMAAEDYTDSISGRILTKQLGETIFHVRESRVLMELPGSKRGLD